MNELAKVEKAGAIEQTQLEPVAMEKLLMEGNLGALSPQMRLAYYKRRCEDMGLDSLARPFDYIMLNGKLVLYANKGCFEQLRANRKISITITKREKFDDLFVVSALAVMPDGRTDEATGAVSLGTLKGESAANAIMKAETKAKRRVTLSICGLGMLDETETDSIPSATRIVVDSATGEVLSEKRALHGKEYTSTGPELPGPCSMCENPAVAKDELGRYCKRHVPPAQKPENGAGLAPGEINGPDYAWLDETAPGAKPGPPAAIPASSPIASAESKSADTIPKGDGGGSMQPAPEKSSHAASLKGVVDRGGVGGGYGEAPMAPGRPRRLTKGKSVDEIAGDKFLFLKAAKVWKGRLVDVDGTEPNRRYYAVLARLDAGHADELRGDAARAAALKGWSDEFTAISGPSGGKGPEPGAVPVVPEAPAPSPAEPPVPGGYDPGWEQFSKDMGYLLARAPNAFMHKLAEWSFPSIAAIPISERQGRLEAMRTVCR
jgi:hypothetical protein